MTALRARRLVAAIGCAAMAASCGAKGDPLAPLRPIPVPVSDFSIERDGAAIKLRIPVPDANTDQSTPPAVERIEIYAMTQAADATPPGTTDLVLPANLIATLDVRPPIQPTKEPKPAKPGETPPPDPRPAAGEVTSYLDKTAPADASVRYFAAIAATGRRRSHTGTILAVPLGAPAAAPADVKTTYTEQKLTLAWTSTSPELRFIVEENNEQGDAPKRLTASPQETTTYEEPVEFGKNRCFTVRAAEVKGAVVTIGAASAPACVTARDRFPPPIPSGLQAVPVDAGTVELLWSAVQSADLAGYVILRGDGANGTLTPITPKPVVSTPYRDTTVKPGSTYVYAVVSIDKAVPPNMSEISNKSVVTVRTPAPAARHER